jgi:hypothetical protein
LSLQRTSIPAISSIAVILFVMAPLTNEGENESYDDEVHHLGWTSFLLSELLYDILKTSEII